MCSAPRFTRECYILCAQARGSKTARNRLPPRTSEQARLRRRQRRVKTAHGMLDQVVSTGLHPSHLAQSPPPEPAAEPERYQGISRLMARAPRPPVGNQRPHPPATSATGVASCPPYIGFFAGARTPYYVVLYMPS